MNRRTMIKLLACALAPSIAQAQMDENMRESVRHSGTLDGHPSSTVGAAVGVSTVLMAVVKLEDFGGFTFIYKGESVHITPDEIWAALKQ